MKSRRKPVRWKIRELGADDQDFLREMLYVPLWDPPNEPRRPRSVLEQPVARRLVGDWGRPDDFALGAIDPESGDSVGAIWTWLDGYDDLEDHGCPFPCLGIAVRPEFQSQGAGSFLLKSLIADFAGKAGGLRRVVQPKNAAAIERQPRGPEQLGF